LFTILNPYFTTHQFWQQAENLIALLEAFIIQNKAFDDKLFQGSGSPDAKLRGLIGVDTITY